MSNNINYYYYHTTPLVPQHPPSLRPPSSLSLCTLYLRHLPLVNCSNLLDFTPSPKRKVKTRTKLTILGFHASVSDSFTYQLSLLRRSLFLLFTYCFIKGGRLVGLTSSQTTRERQSILIAMVSIRRRKLLGLCSGRSNAFSVPLPKFSENGYTPEPRMQNSKPVSVHPVPSNDVDETKEKSSPRKAPGSSNVPAFTEPKEQHIQQFPEVKRRKRHRRKHFENQEQCVMRGVYFKNMKWQAAIKVDKKQIHLGTVGSQEEAARLYDRAAFMCGREPNFELSEEEKQELRKFKWDEFLAITRSAITHKKHHRRTGAGSRRKSEPLMVKSEWESEQGGNGLSGSEEAAEPDTSGS